METLISKWNELYKSKNYVYGTLPNVYFKSVIEKYRLKGNILLPGEGEGRNAVFAATKGLNVFAFDISSEGKAKAMLLANNNNVNICYNIGDFIKMEYANNSFDVVALIYAHFPSDIQSLYNEKIFNLLKPQGIVIIEGFSKNNLFLKHHNSDVPAIAFDKLYTTESIKKDFSNFEILNLEEKIIDLKEGLYHEGNASVVRFLGKKTN